MFSYPTALRMRRAAVIGPWISRQERAPTIRERAHPDLIPAGGDIVDQHDSQGIHQVADLEVDAPTPVEKGESQSRVNGKAVQ